MENATVQRQHVRSKIEPPDSAILMILIAMMNGNSASTANVAQALKKCGYEFTSHAECA